MYNMLHICCDIFRNINVLYDYRLEVLKMFPILLRIFALEHLKINVVRFQPRFGFCQPVKTYSPTPISQLTYPILEK